MSLSALLPTEGHHFWTKGARAVDVCPRCGGGRPTLQVHAGLFRCTRCGLAGGPLQYLVASGMRAVDAARALGIQLTTPKQVLRTLRMARMLFERTLWSEGLVATSYLQARGIRPNIAARFHLGATPAAGSLVRHLRRQGFAPVDLLASGLLRRQGSRFVELLRSRLIFPLCDPTGRTLGFAGRALDTASLKYLNTRVSAAGSGRNTLFGLPQAARAIRRQRCAWIVEGYIDVLACHQAQLDWVVAVGGTLPTILQALQLRRLSSRVVLLLDGGTVSEVVLRAARPLRAVGLEVMAATLPAGVDPDALVIREGPDALVRVAARAARLIAL